MLGDRWQIFLPRALVVYAAITIGLIADRASAQYCDERFYSCRADPSQRLPYQRYPDQTYPYQGYPQPDWRYAPVQPRGVAPQVQPAPYRAAPRPGPVARPDATQTNQYAALY